MVRKIIEHTLCEISTRAFDRFYRTTSNSWNSSNTSNHIEPHRTTSNASNTSNNIERIEHIKTIEPNLIRGSSRVKIVCSFTTGARAHKIRRPHKANLDMAGKILTWRENSAASQSKRAWNAPWNAPSPPRIFSCRHDNVMTTRDKKKVRFCRARWQQGKTCTWSSFKSDAVGIEISCPRKEKVDQLRCLTVQPHRRKKDPVVKAAQARQEAK